MLWQDGGHPEAGFTFTPDAGRAACLLGLARVDARVVNGTFPEEPAIAQLMQVLAGLALVPQWPGAAIE